MSLKIYEAADPDMAFSVDSEFTNPMRHSFDGRLGGIKEVRYYLRNDEEGHEFFSTTMTITDGGGRNIVDGTDGYSFKLAVGDTQPLAEEWDTIDPGNTIAFADLVGSNTNTYLPFWIRIEVPRGAQVESFTDVVFQIDTLDNGF